MMALKKGRGTQERLTDSWKITISGTSNKFLRKDKAPRARLELAANRLTADCSTIELPRNYVFNVFSLILLFLFLPAF